MAFQCAQAWGCPTEQAQHRVPVLGLTAMGALAGQTQTQNLHLPRGVPWTDLGGTPQNRLRFSSLRFGANSLAFLTNFRQNVPNMAFSAILGGPEPVTLIAPLFRSGEGLPPTCAYIEPCPHRVLPAAADPPSQLIGRCLYGPGVRIVYVPDCECPLGVRNSPQAVIRSTCALLQTPVCSLCVHSK